MAANSGKLSENVFVKTMESKGSVVFRMRDAADLFGLNKKKVAIFPLPSDYLIVEQGGKTIFAEVKSTQSKGSFSLDMLTNGQKAALVKVTSRKGHYHIYIHNLNTDTWYLMTGSEYLIYHKAGMKSVKWEILNAMD